MAALMSQFNRHVLLFYCCTQSVWVLFLLFNIIGSSPAWFVSEKKRETHLRLLLRNPIIQLNCFFPRTCTRTERSDYNANPRLRLVFFLLQTRQMKNEILTHSSLQHTTKAAAPERLRSSHHPQGVLAQLSPAERAGCLGSSHRRHNVC